MASRQRLFLLSIVTLKTLGLVIENTFTTPQIRHIKLLSFADVWQYAVDINQYGLDLSGITTLTFEVKACNDVTIIMSNSDDGNSSKPIYQFIIGGWRNKISAIQRRSYYSLTQDAYQTFKFNTLGLCQCAEYRPFWISTKNGVLMIGKGFIIGTNVVAEWTDPNPFTVRRIGIYTNIWRTGVWKVQIEVVNNLYDGHFSRCTTNYKAVLNILISNNNTSLLSCAVLCDMLLSCIGFNYHKQSCELVALGPGVVRNIPMKQEEGWKFYSKCYRYNGACLWCYF
ncbi:Hypothetical predicted protein [Mytilus galloprovincialis]|uniref:Farnesoic acid O-methyl transferase domain-containing protein n=1 Tax=Mytilus galloprovincialis TaxID=29158 RepID=A0A8B6EI39_MYTGA|nr:Hypothetical predicted protein [Mytilus galloprovincialis]